MKTYQEYPGGSKLKTFLNLFDGLDLTKCEISFIHRISLAYRVYETKPGKSAESRKEKKKNWRNRLCARRARLIYLNNPANNPANNQKIFSRSALFNCSSKDTSALGYCRKIYDRSQWWIQ